jgi:hypothetical protein
MSSSPFSLMPSGCSRASRTLKLDEPRSEFILTTRLGATYYFRKLDDPPERLHAFALLS